MSNYIKYNYVQQKPQTKARVINSNPKMEEVMRGYQSAQKFEPQSFGEEGSADLDADADGFSAGLDVDYVEEIPQISPEEMLDEARRQADEILQEAQARAQQILEDANEQAQAVFEEQKEAGFEEGCAQAQEELSAKQEDLQVQLDQQRQLLENEYNEKKAQLEKEIVDALCHVIAKTFGIYMDDQQETLVYLIEKTMFSIENGKNFRIRVSVENAKYINEKLPELRSQFSSDINIEVQHDQSLDEQACVIETEYGVYHCGIDVQLKNLLRQMKLLSI